MLSTHWLCDDACGAPPPIRSRASGLYYVIARFDSEPNSFGGYTYDVQDQQHNKGNCRPGDGCGERSRHVRGNRHGGLGISGQRVRGWWLDVDGLPLIDPWQPSPSYNESPSSAAVRYEPHPVQHLHRHRIWRPFLLPTGWREIKAQGSRIKVLFSPIESWASADQSR